MTKGASFTAAVGFDGYVDRIARVVSGSGADGQVYHKDIPQFADLLRSMAGKSGDLEIVTVDVRTGGCAPNLANALAGLRADVTLVGATKHDIFQKLHPAIRSISYGVPGDTLALEFDDGKIMMADITEMCRSVVALMDDRETMGAVEKAYRSADLCVLTNWACLPEMHALWEAAVSQIKRRSDRPKVFMDVADFTKRSDDDLTKLINLIRSMGDFETYLGLNEKEALMLTERFGAPQPGVREASDCIKKMTGSHIIIHGIGYCVYAGGADSWRVEGKVADRPKISTGAGDHFNAAWCHAVMGGFPTPKAMEYANQFAYDYVTGAL